MWNDLLETQMTMDPPLLFALPSCLFVTYREGKGGKRHPIISPASHTLFVDPMLGMDPGRGAHQIYGRFMI